MTKFLNISTDTTLGGNAPSDELAVSQKAIKTYVDSHGGGVSVDGLTITRNSDQEIQTVAVIDQNSGIAKTWTGTMAEYEAIVTKDPETEYIITDDIGGSATEIGQITEDINDLKEHTVVEFQEPTAANGYTWYRKYADGWVEQGGTYGGSQNQTISLLVEMADNKYSLMLSFSTTSVNTPTYSSYAYRDKTTTSFVAINSGSINGDWQVSGIAA